MRFFRALLAGASLLVCASAAQAACVPFDGSLVDLSDTNRIDFCAPTKTTGGAALGPAAVIQKCEAVARYGATGSLVDTIAIQPASAIPPAAPLSATFGAAYSQASDPNGVLELRCFAKAGTIPGEPLAWGRVATMPARFRAPDVGVGAPERLVP